MPSTFHCQHNIANINAKKANKKQANLKCLVCLVNPKRGQKHVLHKKDFVHG